MAVELGVLGAIEVRRDGRRVEVGHVRQQCVLAALLVDANTAMPADQLIDRVWGEHPPARARGTLYSYLSRLRRVLAGTGQVRLERRPTGYVLAVDPSLVDMHRFSGLLSRARVATADEAALALLEEALRLWRGEPFAGLDTAWVNTVRDTLEAARFAAELDLGDLQLRSGQHATMLPALAARTDAHPLDERLVAQRMLALYRSGRQAEALEAYRSVSRLLAEELGIDPGPELRQVHQAVLTADPALALPGRDRSAAADPGQAWLDQAWRVVCQLPPDLADLAGRDDVRARLLATLSGQANRAAAPPVVAITGPPGVGKTALAVAVAHVLRGSYPDGQWYVRLAGTGGRPLDQDEALRDWLIASGMHPAAVPREAGQRAAALRARLADRRVLLILDDAAGPGQVRPLLPGTAASAVIITSRRLLSGLAGAETVQLGPLDRAGATAVLTAVVGAARVAREPAAAADLAGHCAGLPLALRISAARLAARPDWTLARLADRLADERRRLDELAVDDLAVRASLRLSYDLLDAGARAAFRQLGLLGAADLAAWSVAALAGVGDGEPVLDRLLDANLLAPAGPDEAGEPRYRMHDLTALYAVERAQADGAAANRAAIDRYHQALLALVDACARRLPAGMEALPAAPLTGQPAAGAADRAGWAELDRLSADPASRLRAESAAICRAIERACEHGQPALAAALADRALAEHLRDRLAPGQPERLYRLIRDRAHADGEELVAWRAEVQRCRLDVLRGRVTATMGPLQACAAAFTRLDASAELAYSLAELAFCHSDQGNDSRAVELAGRAVALADRGVPVTRAHALTEYGTSLARAGRHEEAYRALDRALALMTERDERHAAGLILMRVTIAARRHGDLTRARQAAERARDLLRAADDPCGVGWTLLNLAYIAIAERQPATAVTAASDAGALLAEVHDSRGQVQAELARAEAHLELGEPGRAVAILPGALEAATAAHNPQLTRAAQSLLARARRLAGQPRASAAG
ncbi:MAG TPA: BTAD domain-containing putative transcriptional regulator [Mycobacteriales bacterium]|nr:BTAD domain-containing putative transcriptional regulator [Mycobacteriales bacterium]